jgi:hypothetical protein
VGILLSLAPSLLLLPTWDKPLVLMVTCSLTLLINTVQLPC